MPNFLTAIKVITELTNSNIDTITSGNNRANNMGEGLESYVKKAFANSFQCVTEKEELEREKNVFSYIGNKNNPPDLILANGDAIEVKKIESRSNSLQLNSSPPKSKLFNTDSRLTKACVECE